MGVLGVFVQGFKMRRQIRQNEPKNSNKSLLILINSVKHGLWSENIHYDEDMLNFNFRQMLKKTMNGMEHYEQPDHLV